MPSILKKAISLLIGDDYSTEFLKLPSSLRPFKRLTERELIQPESEIGGTLFGSIPTGGRREFFNLDENTWIWHEELVDRDGLVHSTTTRYEVQKNKVLKAQDGAHYSYLDGEELHNFSVAVQMYYEQVMRGVYKRDPKTGHKIL